MSKQVLTIDLTRTTTCVSYIIQDHVNDSQITLFAQVRLKPQGIAIRTVSAAAASLLLTQNSQFSHITERIMVANLELVQMDNYCFGTKLIHVVHVCE